MKWRPCWCPKAVLLELTSFLLQTLSVVPVNYQHRCWSREWKRSILEFFCFCSSVFWGRGSGGEGYSLVWPIRGCAAGQGMAFYLSGLNRVYDFVQVCPNWGSRVINLRVLSLIGSGFQTLSGSPIPKMKYWSFRSVREWTTNSRGFCKCRIPLSKLVYTITKGLLPRQTPQLEIRQ